MNSDLFLVIEIVGEGSMHKVLNQPGYSGRDYRFFWNSLTHSHIRSYRSIEIYREERVDMHKAANIWPLMPDLLPVERIEAQCWTTPAPVPVPKAFTEALMKPLSDLPMSGAPVLHTRESLDALGFREVRPIAKAMGIVTHELNKGALIDAILMEQDAKGGAATL